MVKRAWFAAVDLEVDGWERPVHLIGVGKVNAALSTSSVLGDLGAEMDEAVLVGTAGALRAGLRGVYEVGAVEQHDYDHLAIAALVGDSHSATLTSSVAPVVEPDRVLGLLTGDVFLQDETARDLLAVRGSIVDMEGYAFAAACERAGVPWRIAKCVTDEASGTSADDWRRTVRSAAVELDRWASLLP
jgi:adenosylhomocysteine nucleosidase